MKVNGTKEKIDCNRRNCRGFTTMELIVTMSIVMLLCAILASAIQRSREVARRMQCQNNLKQLGIALSNYEETHRRFPGGITSSENDQYPLTTYVNQFVLLLPLIDKAPLFHRYDFDQPWFTQEVGLAAEPMAVLSVSFCGPRHSIGCETIPTFIG